MRLFKKKDETPVSVIVAKYIVRSETPEKRRARTEHLICLLCELLPPCQQAIVRRAIEEGVVL